MLHVSCLFIFFFFNDTATTEIYTLSLHDALPICLVDASSISLTPSLEKENLTWKYYRIRRLLYLNFVMLIPHSFSALMDRSEEHTSELQSLTNLVCRLLLEKKKIYRNRSSTTVSL